MLKLMHTRKTCSFLPCVVGLMVSLPLWICYDFQVLVFQQIEFRYRVPRTVVMVVMNVCLLLCYSAVFIHSLQHYLGWARDIVHGAIAPSEQTHVVINVHVQKTPCLDTCI